MILPFAYESTGTETRFTNILEPDYRSRGVFTFHRPDELIRLARLDSQLRGHLRHMPPLHPGRLWPIQVEAIGNLERSLAAGRPRSLIQMATGSGKTFTACSFCYRLIKFARAKRILFLVDRTNLGRQTINEFQHYPKNLSPHTGYKFTEEYNVQHLRQAILKRAFEGKLVPRDSSEALATMPLQRTTAHRRETPGNVGPRRSK